jgi:hypothetical protein
MKNSLMIGARTVDPQSPNGNEKASKCAAVQVSANPVSKAFLPFGFWRDAVGQKRARKFVGSDRQKAAGIRGLIFTWAGLDELKGTTNHD